MQSAVGPSAAADNLHALFRAMAKSLPGGEIEERPGFALHHTFPTNPMFKGVWATRLEPGEVEAALDQAVAWFRARQAPYFFWWSAPGSTPKDLGDRLIRHGLLSMEEQQKELAPGIHQTAAGAPVMVADLGKMNESVLRDVPEGLTIGEAATDADLEAFKAVFVETYAIPEWAGQAWVDATRAIGIGRTPWRIYVGRINGRAVATTMLFVGGGVASVYAVATIAADRGKGVGSAITLKPLLDARDAGERHAVLFSTEMGVGPYTRIGFRMTDGRINRYLWRAPA